MTINKTKLKKIVKEEIKRTLNEGFDQKTWFTVKGLRPRDKSGRDFIEIATIELPASFTIPHDSSGLYAKLTEEGIAYVTEKVPRYSTEPGKNQILPSAKPNVIPWQPPVDLDDAAHS